MKFTPEQLRKRLRERTEFYRGSVRIKPSWRDDDQPIAWRRRQAAAYLLIPYIAIAAAGILITGTILFFQGMLAESWVLLVAGMIALALTGIGWQLVRDRTYWRVFFDWKPANERDEAD